MMSAEQQWLKLDAGSEYDKNWKPYFSLREAERVTELAEKLVAEAQGLEPAAKWHAASAGRGLWIVLVLHVQRNRLIRAPGHDAGGRTYVETVLPWSRYTDLAADQQQRVIVDRVRAVFDELNRREVDADASTGGR